MDKFIKGLFASFLLLAYSCKTMHIHGKKAVPVSDTARSSRMLPLGVPTIPGSFSAISKQGPKPYKEIITSKAITSHGLFTVHKVDDKFYFEIPDSLLGKEILAVTRFVKVPWGGSQYGGEEANQNVLRFEKAPDNKIFIRVSLNIVSSPDSTKPIFEAVKNSSVDPIAVAFDIKTFGKDSTSSIIDVTDFLKGDNQIVSIDPNLKRRFGLTGLAPDRSYIETIKTFPINTEVKRIMTFGASSSGSPVPSPFPSSSLPSAQASGVVTLELNTSFLLLPKIPMQRRLEDPRVGFFSDKLTVFEDNSQKVDPISYITRWRLEPKDEDVEKFKNGILVEPKKQIVYYIDPATPKEWRPYLIAGINDWQKAFEKAGFKNAIIGKEWPTDDTTMSLEDARFSVLRYFASNIENAYGPNVNDPRSGEILETHIGWYHNVMKLLHDWYFIQAAAVDPRARTMNFDSTLMGDLIRFVSSHEVGHTLGLRHNMGSSSKTPVEKLRDKAWVEANGHTASIMDYARFNYVAQPEDNIGPAGIYPRIGEYDKWAIEWGYKSTGAKTPEADKKITNKWVIDSLKANPRLWFGTYEYGNSADPRSQSEDLGDNAMKASEYGIKNLKRILVKLPEWTKEEGDKYDNLENMYGQLVSQFSRYMGHVLRNVGGVYETPKSIEQNGEVYEEVPKTLQKDAISFLNTQLFETPNWLLDKNILNEFSNPIGTELIQNTQTGVLNSLITGARLGRMISASNRFGKQAYTADDMLTDVKKGIFEELVTKKPIDNYRRNLQKSFIEGLINLLPTSTNNTGGFIISIFGGAPSIDPKKSDLSSIARGQLLVLQSEIKAALPGFGDKMSKLHLQDMTERLRVALNPK